MKCYSGLCYVAFAVAAALFAFTSSPYALATDQQTADAPPAQVSESENTDYSEDEFNAFDALQKEPDLDKKAALLLDFVQKYPKPTSLTPSINYEYSQLLDRLSAAKKYESQASLAEKWLKIHSDDIHTVVHLADATGYLKNYDRCAECLEEIYAKQPSPSIARSLFLTYQSSNNLAKQIEWSDKLFKMPEFDNDYLLRWGFVRKYMESNNIPKAAEYAQLTLKSADLVKQPSPETRNELKKIRQVSHHVIGVNLFEKDKFEEAIAAFDKAIKIENYSDGYYFMGKCLDNQAARTKSQDTAEAAMSAYAKAELLGGDNASKANERITQIFRALHANSEVGKDKVYKRAQIEMKGSDRGK